MPLLRRYLTCFYCGSRSNLIQTASVHDWQCKVCEAVNYLDENGDITDPPALESPLAVQYAQHASRASSPELAPAERDIFCATCIKNHELHRKALALYLPAADDPEYNAFESAYDEYRKNLDERYPQMCVECAPRVRDRIRNSSYAAKTDALRRIMESSRHGQPKNSTKYPWRSFVIRLGGVIWWTSVIIELSWHAIAMLFSGYADNMMSSGFTPDSRECVKYILAEKHSHIGCISEGSKIVRFALIGALGSIWWNNRLSERAVDRSSRLVGLQEHTKLQIASLTGRVAAWWFLKEPESFTVNLSAYRGFHLLSVILLITYVTLSSRLIRIVHGQKIGLSQNIEPLLPQAPTSQAGQAFSPDKRIYSQSLSYAKSFPVSKLSPPEIEQTNTKFQPREPVSFIRSNESLLRDANLDDEMEWSPTKPSSTFLIPENSFKHQDPGTVRLTPPRPSKPSPFYGALPPAPINPAHRLRNPPNQHMFSRAPEGEQGNLFRSIGGLRSGDVAQHRSAEDDDDFSTVAGTPMPKTRRDWELTSPKLRWNENLVDTGLESLFDSVFSIQDKAPLEVRASAPQGNGMLERSESFAVLKMIILWCTPLLIGIGVIVIRRYYLESSQ